MSNVTNRTRWVDKHYAAERLGISVTTLQRWMRREIVPYYKIPATGAVRFDRLELDDMVMRNRVEQVDEARLAREDDEWGL